MSLPTQAAPALLGSTLLTAAEAKEVRKPLPASSGAADIDDIALEGGFRYGEITSIAGATGTGKTLLAYQAAASHLLAHTSGEVVLMDTSGSFSPVRIRDVLSFRLRASAQRTNFAQTGYMYEKTSAQGKVDEVISMKEATSMLDRVNVMRVFDLAGIAEAIGEVGEMIEQSARVPARQRRPLQRRRTNEVVDSEDDLDDEGDAAEEEASTADHQAFRSVGMIIIDTITNVVSAMVTKNQTQGQALLATVMRSLRHLTAQQRICTLLTNAAVGMTASKGSEYKRWPDDHVSIFASTKGRPALGKSFAYLIDTSIFLSSVPKTSADAMAAYGGKSNTQSWRNALVIEVLKDRCGGREGRWTGFEIVSDVKLVAC